MSDYEVGYGKPPKHTRFGAGNKANPNGKTSAHRKAEIAAAELAAKVQLDLMQALSNTIDAAKGDEVKIENIKSDVLKLLKDTQDRAFGTAQQHVDNTSSDGYAQPTSIRLITVDKVDKSE